MSVHPFNPEDLPRPGQDHAWTDPDHARHTIADAALAWVARRLDDEGHQLAAERVERFREDLVP